MKDALGNDIKIGHMYGYSSSKGSHISVVTGRVEKITEKGVTLIVHSRQGFLYGEPNAYFSKSAAKKVSVTSVLLFPIPPSVNLLTDATSSGQRTGMQIGTAIALDVIDEFMKDFEDGGFYPTLKRLRGKIAELNNG